MNILGKLLSAFLVLGFLTLAVVYGWLQTGLHGAGPLTEEKLVYIAPGTSTRAIAAKMTAEGAIDAPPLVFIAGARLAQGAGGLKAGEYRLSPGMSVADIISLLQSGKTHQRRITIPEGLMAVEIMELVNQAEAMEGLVETLPPEGSLLPETYSYSRGDDRQTLIARMQRNMTQTLDELWAGRSEGLPVKTKEEAVTLASIVEKETGMAEERPRVAGVFVNRLRKSMPLQSDPTTIYAITKGEKKLERPLYRKDLDIDSPYNTYKAGGLPPGPIANPGRKSLEAVMHPELHDFYYFVADGTGGHAFGKTLDDHNRNVGKWREIQRGAGKTAP